MGNNSRFSKKVKSRNKKASMRLAILRIRQDSNVSRAAKTIDFIKFPLLSKEGRRGGWEFTTPSYASPSKGRRMHSARLAAGLRSLKLDLKLYAPRDCHIYP